MTTIWGPGPNEYHFFWAWELARPKEGATAGLLAGRAATAGLGTDSSSEPVPRYHERFRDRLFAHNFLARFQRDPIAVARLRAILRESGPGTNLPLLTVDEVFTEIAHLLATQRLVPGLRPYGTGGTSDEAPQAIPARSSSGVPAAPAQTGPEDEAPTFPDNDGAAQAAALKAAAQTGVPFCEECAKAAAAAALKV